MFIKQEVRIGDNRELAKQLPDNFIDCLVTSPPYWRARYYDTQPLIYGGKPDCDHVWVETTTRLANSGVEGHRNETSYTYATCQRCNVYKGELGWESTPEDFINHLVEIFDVIKPKLKDGGSVWVNLGDKYFDSTCKHDVLKPRSLCLVPQRFAWKMIEHGWMCINEGIWVKKNHMPEPYKTRLTRAHEQIYHFVKNPDYFYDIDAIRVPHKTKCSTSTIRKIAQTTDFGKTSAFNGDVEHSYHPLGGNPGDVFEISTESYKGSHTAPFPLKLIKIPILATTPKFICKKCGKPRERIMKSETVNRTATNGWGNGAFYDGSFGNSLHRQVGWSDCGCNAEFDTGVVLDPFCGSGTVLEFCRQNGYNAIGFDLNPDYKPLIEERAMMHTPQLKPTIVPIMDDEPPKIKTNTMIAEV